MQDSRDNGFGKVVIIILGQRQKWYWRSGILLALWWEIMRMV
jgi:hypothetical protein